MTRMSIKKSMMLALLVCGGCVLCGGLALNAGTASAEELFTADTYRVEGASVRLVNSQTDETGNGIRFSVVMDTATYATLVDSETGALKEGVETGTILLPTDLLEGELTLETENASVVLTTDLWREIVSEEGTYMRSLVYLWDIPSQYYGRDISAAGYIKQNGETVYTSSLSRSMTYVATAAVDNDPGLKPQLDEYLPDCTVSFNAASGEKLAEDITLKYGDASDALTAVPSGYDGWYTDPACTEKYSAETVKENLTLYARSLSIVEDFENVSASGINFVGDISKITTSNYATLALTDKAEEVPEGGSGKALRVSREKGAAGTYPGATVTMNQKLTVGAQYEFSATVRAISNVTQIFMKLEGNVGGHKEFNKVLTAGQTAVITGKITVTKENPDILLFFVSNEAHVNEEAFAIDNVTVTECAQLAITGLPANNAVNKLKGEYTLGYRFLGGAAEGEVKWTSSDPEVASVDGGIVTPLKAGNTDITASSGEYACTVTLTVTEPTVLVNGTFDEGFSVTGDSNVGWTGSRAGSAVTFTGTGFDMQCSPNEAHLPAGGSGNCLFFQPWDGSWAKLNLNNMPLEAGKKYEIGFKMRLINHNAALNVFKLYVTVGETTVTVPVEVSAVGATADFSYIMDFTKYDSLEKTEIFLSIETSSETQISLDNFYLYEV